MEILEIYRERGKRGIPPPSIETNEVYTPVIRAVWKHGYNKFLQAAGQR